MGWIKRKKNEHVCPKPELYGADKPDYGDVWECDDCGTQWKVSDSQRDGMYWSREYQPR